MRKKGKQSGGKKEGKAKNFMKVKRKRLNNFTHLSWPSLQRSSAASFRRKDL